MQGKGLIKVLLALLIFVCVLQCSYILPTRSVEKDADEYAAMIAENAGEGADIFSIEKQARIAYLDSMSSEEVFRIPGLQSYTYDELKKRQLALGLDLKGGQSAVLQVDLRELLIALSGNNQDETFRTALDNAQAALANSQSDFISLFGQEYQKLNPERKLVKIFNRNPMFRDETDAQTSDGEMIRILRQKSNETVNLTFTRLKQRIDKLGVTQPNVSLDAARDVIIVELPGVDNPERARKFLQASAQLEFWEVYRISDAGLANSFLQADEILKRSAAGDTSNIQLDENIVQYDTTWIPQYDSTGTTIDSIPNIVERPKDPFSDQGPLLSIFTLNSPTGGNTILYSNAVMGVADENKMEAVSRMLERDEIRKLFPADVDFKWSQKPVQDFETRESTKKHTLYAIKKKSATDNTAPLEGDRIVNASQSPNPTTGEVEVSIMMDGQGSKIWGAMTTKAAQDQNREIAIALDDEIISAPRVDEAILGGSSVIRGNFSVQEAQDLANMLEVGKLPAKVKIIQEANVGPSLGAENIRRSFISLVAGLGLVLVFMVFYYGGAGLVSIVALFANLFFIFGALASFGTVLTLPGIAGIVLTIGMAVDANVIIFERVREELRSGKSMLMSITDGFKHSYSAIIDANVTTILVATVLAYFGLGPIKGFAVVLIIGVLSSLFTAVLLGKMMIDWWTQGKSRNIGFWTGWSKNALANLNIDWIGKRRYAYVFSTVFILAGLISIFTKGFDLGVDFKGGYSYNIEFQEDAEVDAQTLREGLTEVFGSTPVVKAVDTENTYNVVTSYLINDTDDDAPDRVMSTLHQGVNSIIGGDIDFEKFKTPDAQNVTHVTSYSKVGPTIADDIKKSSFYAGIFALLLIFLYIFIRFSKWQYSLGAVAALFHDSLVVLSFFSIFHGILPLSMEIDQAFIAALLTVIGYSINDTVVVFDRIREFLGIYTNKTTDEVLNLSINSTFSRTIVTSLTTFLVVSILFFFGGGSIKGFALALMIGIIIGTYSSIFVASPIVRDLTKELKPVAKKRKSSSSFSRAARARS